MLFSALICACGEYKLEEESTKGKHRKMSHIRFKSLPEVITMPKSTIRFPSFSLTKEAHASNKPPFQTLLLHIIIVFQKGNTPSSYYPASLKTNI